MTPDQERELTEVFAAWRVMLAQTTPDAAGKCISMLRDLRGHIETVLATCLPATTAGNWPPDRLPAMLSAWRAAVSRPATKGQKRP